ncbi:hypothetical protein [Aliivibrio logei]|uniref:Tricorn protease domain-containing protein n=1 Tax=Aliivibrio logei 5S-186 TaxID=626086 RepID=A0ABX3AWI8_ALILO|nr:hypothetical protein [Aliivibrio logei]OEF12814.1 hypothetical protein A1Q5_08870 [Aliivibrio logei 5S-186]
MKKILLLTLFGITLMGCNDPESVAAEAAQLRAEQHPDRTYVGENNYYTMNSSEDAAFGRKKELKVMYQDFPRYFVEKAKEWPKEDLNDASSYDLPRFQFAWANSSSKDEYESGLKIWSMKTDGTDLRLVTDVTVELVNGIKNLTRSPNNRYVAWADLGGYKTVYDIKTGKVVELSIAMSPLPMLWSEDSRYLYFERARDLFSRWDSETGEISEIDFQFSSFAKITDDTLVSLNVYGVYKLNLISNEGVLLKSSESLPREQRKLDIRSISPTGRYAWGSNPSYGFFFDIEKGTVKQMVDDFVPAQILGKDAHYSALSKMTYVTIVDRVEDKVWSWRAFSHGAMSGEGILYNGLANDGLWFRENK